MNIKILNRYRGFTLIEVLVVLVILGIAAAIAVPLFGASGSTQAQSAAEMITGDLEYARSMSIAHQGSYGVSFNTVGGTYQVIDPNGNVISHPVNVGSNYVVNLKTSGFAEVSLTQADFEPGATNTIKFNYLGSPLNGSGADLNAGTIKVTGSGVTYTITISAVTGYIQVQ
jgi:prepilin-type N-terminal cleavage/methylation domain-containing protein